MKFKSVTEAVKYIFNNEEPTGKYKELAKETYEILLEMRRNK